MILAPMANLAVLNNPHTGIEAVYPSLSRLADAVLSGLSLFGGRPWPAQHAGVEAMSRIMDIQDGFGVLCSFRDPYSRFVSAYLEAKANGLFSSLADCLKHINPVSIRSDYRLAAFVPQHTFIVRDAFWFAGINDQGDRNDYVVTNHGIRHEFFRQETLSAMSCLGMYVDVQDPDPPTYEFLTALEYLLRRPVLFSYVTRLYAEDFVLLQYEMHPGADMTPQLDLEKVQYSLSPLWILNFFSAGVVQDPSTVNVNARLREAIARAELKPFEPLTDLFKVSDQHHASN
jgi:hypothetical protein